MRIALAIVIMSLASFACSADNTLEVLADDLSNPWSVAFLPDGEYLVAERGGQIQRLYSNGSIPGNNPFFARGGTAAKVWSYGHRSPQGLTISLRQTVTNCTRG